MNAFLIGWIAALGANPCPQTWPRTLVPSADSSLVSLQPRPARILLTLFDAWDISVLSEKWKPILNHLSR